MQFFISRKYTIYMHRNDRRKIMTDFFLFLLCFFREATCHDDVTRYFHDDINTYHDSITYTHHINIVNLLTCRFIPTTTVELLFLLE